MQIHSTSQPKLDAKPTKLAAPRFANLALASLAILSTSLFCGSVSVSAQGIYRNGIGARSLALGGADVAYADDALGAMTANPAALGFLGKPEFDFDLGLASAHGSFTNAANPDGSLGETPGFLPSLAFATPLGSRHFALGVSSTPEGVLSGTWSYIDPPGGVAGASYGLQHNKSSIILLRTALGIGASLGDKVSIGATIGLLYNRNRLEAPYIFQQQPQLQGLKTLLDLKTDGYGWNGTFGVLLRPTKKFTVGVNYETETTIVSRGPASGNASAQLDAAGIPIQPDFTYDGQVSNKFPNRVQAGISWNFAPRLRATAQFDWTQWSNSFVTLPVLLTNGSNTDLNGVVGSDSLFDQVPLHWKDQETYRIGLEAKATKHLVVRGGYSHANNPVPNETLTPLTAAIMQDTLTVGAGYDRHRWNFDAAYQRALNNAVTVGTSALRSGEYSNSRTEVGVQAFTITAALKF